MGYLKEWKRSINARDDVPHAVKPTMLLSRATREGLQITGLVKLIDSSRVQFLLCSEVICGCDEVHYILSECFSQDPLENFFGQLRAGWGYCKNPTFQSCLTSSQSIRVQGRLSMLPIRGNSCRKKGDALLRNLLTIHPLLNDLDISESTLIIIVSSSTKFTDQLINLLSNF